jgi:hypothetical protein
MDEISAEGDVDRHATPLTDKHKIAYNPTLTFIEYTVDMHM